MRNVTPDSWSWILSRKNCVILIWKPSNGFSILSFHDRMRMQCQLTSCAIIQHDIGTTKAMPKYPPPTQIHPSPKFIEFSREWTRSKFRNSCSAILGTPIHIFHKVNQWRNEIPTAEGKPGSPGRDGKLQLGNAPLAWVSTTWITVHSIHVCVKVWWKQGAWLPHQCLVHWFGATNHLPTSLRGHHGQLF